MMGAGYEWTVCFCINCLVGGGAEDSQRRARGRLYEEERDETDRTRLIPRMMTMTML